jgi:hypothetical protein
MSEWEYRKIDLNDPPRKATDLDLLEKAGEDGWELVVITANSTAYLKRPIAEQRPKRKTQKNYARVTQRTRGHRADKCVGWGLNHREATGHFDGAQPSRAIIEATGEHHSEYARAMGQR